MATDPRRTRAWRVLRDRVLAEEPVCWLRDYHLGRCTYWSTTGDHIQPVETRPDLALDRRNIHGACANCNNDRGCTPLASLVKPGTVPDALAAFD